MIDEYMWGDVHRISPEAPVPVVDVQKITSRLGGAANVVKNLSVLGINPVLVSVIGEDNNGKKLESQLISLDCPTDNLVHSGSRPTTIKTRIMARQQQVVRADQESTIDLNEEESNAIKKKFLNALPEVSGVIISDYGKGVICPGFLKFIVDACCKSEIYVAVDPKERHFDLYNGVSVITPNLKEAYAVLGFPLVNRPTDEEIDNIGWQIVDRLSLNYLLLTLSERGMALFESEKRKRTSLETVAKKVYDVTGAGDTVISLFSACIACGADPVEAAYISNHAAGITVAELGTASVDVETLIKSCVG